MRRGEGWGRPVRTESTRTVSATVRAISPTVSNEGDSGKTPRVGTAPYAGLKPTVPQQAEGIRIDPPVSVPSPIVAW